MKVCMSRLKQWSHGVGFFNGTQEIREDFNQTRWTSWLYARGGQTAHFYHSLLTLLSCLLFIQQTLRISAKNELLVQQINNGGVEIFYNFAFNYCIQFNCIILKFWKKLCLKKISNKVKVGTENFCLWYFEKMGLESLAATSSGVNIFSTCVYTRSLRYSCSFF